VGPFSKESSGTVKQCKDDQLLEELIVREIKKKGWQQRPTTMARAAHCHAGTGLACMRVEERFQGIFADTHCWPNLHSLRVPRLLFTSRIYK